MKIECTYNGHSVWPGNLKITRLLLRYQHTLSLSCGEMVFLYFLEMINSSHYQTIELFLWVSYGAACIYLQSGTYIQDVQIRQLYIFLYDTSNNGLFSIWKKMIAFNISSMYILPINYFYPINMYWRTKCTENIDFTFKQCKTLNIKIFF